MNFLKKYKKYLLAALLFSVFLLITRFISSIDFESLKTYLSKTPYMFVGVLAASLFAYLFSTLAWKLCMAKKPKNIVHLAVHIPAGGRDAFPVQSHKHCGRRESRKPSF